MFLPVGFHKIEHTLLDCSLKLLLLSTQKKKKKMLGRSFRMTDSTLATRHLVHVVCSNR